MNFKFGPSVALLECTCRSQILNLLRDLANGLANWCISVCNLYFRSELAAANECPFYNHSPEIS